MRDGWFEVNLGQLCDLTKGLSPTQKTPPGEYPLVVTAAGPSSSNTYQFDDEAVCVPMVSSTGHGHASIKRVHYAAGKFAVASIVVACIVKDRSLCETRYLWLYLQSRKDEIIVPRMRGTANVSLSKTELGKVPVVLPPLAEQRRIMDLIGALDEAIEAAGQNLHAYRSAATALRSESFTAWLESCPSQLAGEAFEITLGRQKSIAQTTGDHVIPYLRAGNITDGILSLDDVLTMNFTPKEQEKYCLLPGDVLVVEGGSIGQTSRWQGEIEGAVGFDKHVLRIRGVGEKSTTAFAYQWARWCYESGTFAETATGSTIKALGFSRAKALYVPLPHVEAQISGINHLESADEAVTDARRYLKTLESLRTNLLTALLSGEHEIPSSYDEHLGVVA